MKEALDEIGGWPLDYYRTILDKINTFPNLQRGNINQN